ncbi:MAG: hypothetical protein L3J56_00995 [Bacteroidales bacterium]|nr:hypothetical protein [Bacteroidales bacterium]
MDFKTAKDFIVGKNYRFSEIPDVSTDKIEVNEYGADNLGQNAIHIRYLEHEIDVWFIWSALSTEGILKCVYNS